MDSLILLLSSVNKLSLFIFFVGLIFFSVELYQLLKEKEKKAKPQIPQFNIKDFEKKNIEIKKSSVNIKKHNIISRLNIHLILTIILFVMTVFFFILSIISIKNNKKKQSVKNEIVYSEIQSKGIKLFSRDLLKEFNELDITQLPVNTEIIIGIETIPGSDIDRARIKINEKEWTIKHITTLFDKTKKVFYTNYIIATGESKLTIDAQLHSFADGWLGD